MIPTRIVGICIYQTADREKEKNEKRAILCPARLVLPRDRVRDFISRYFLISR